MTLGQKEGAPGSYRLPTGPLKELITSELTHYRGVGHLASRIARTLRTPEAEGRYRGVLDRVLYGQTKTISLFTADEVCIGLGLHPSEVFGMDLYLQGFSACGPRNAVAACYLEGGRKEPHTLVG